MLTSAQEAHLGRIRAQISEARLTPYRKAEKGTLLHALARYFWNVELCQTYYHVLQALEVTLRNRLDSGLGPKFPDSAGGLRRPRLPVPTVDCGDENVSICRDDVRASPLVVGFAGEPTQTPRPARRPQPSTDVIDEMRLGRVGGRNAAPAVWRGWRSPGIGVDQGRHRLSLVLSHR
ncbi:MAG: hypothetical protein ACOY71_02225 [Gemmatimonadota bacterium]